MQIIKAKDLKKYVVFEREVQTYFVLKKAVYAPRQKTKHVSLHCVNLQTLEQEKIALEVEEFVRTAQPQTLVASFYCEREESLVFVCGTSLRQVVVKKSQFSNLLPFLFLNHAYIIFTYKDKVVYIKPKSTFLKINKKNFSTFLEKLTKLNPKLALDTEKEQKQQTNQEYILINTKKFFS